MLPRVKIEFANGALGQVVASPDGVFGLLTSAAPGGGQAGAVKVIRGEVNGRCYQYAWHYSGQ